MVIKLETGRNGLSLCTARDESKRCSCVVFKAGLGVLAELEGVLYADHTCSYVYMSNFLTHVLNTRLTL